MEGGRSTKEALFLAWKARFEEDQKGTLSDQQGYIALSSRSPEKALRRYYRRHSSLRKAESSALVQARTGKIGLRAFLFSRKVPGIVTPLCDCGESPETVEHILGGCPTNPEALDLLRKEGPLVALLQKLQTGQGARPIIRVLMKRLPEYRLTLSTG